MSSSFMFPSFQSGNLSPVSPLSSSSPSIWDLPPHNDSYQSYSNDGAYDSLVLPPMLDAGESIPGSPPRLPSPSFLSELSTAQIREFEEEVPPPSNQEQAAAQPHQQSTFSNTFSFRAFSDHDYGDLFGLLSSPVLSPPAIPAVDLTASSPPLLPFSMAPSRKRRASVSSPRPIKVPRVSKKDTPGTPTITIPVDEKTEVVDLVEAEDNESYKKVRAKQQAEAIKRQQKEEATRSVKLSEFQCVVCMDSPTDLVVTHCGHLFCHYCLHRAIHISNSKKICPSCRQSISTTSPSKDRKRQPKNGVFALEMQFMTAKKIGKRPARARA